MFYEGIEFNVELEDLGDTWKMEGVMIGNGHKSLLMLTPETKGGTLPSEVWQPSIEQMEAWLKQSDNPVSPLFGDDGFKKAVIRKAVRQLDQKIVWACYARDQYTCVYCGVTGVPLTYDHYLAQAYGGKTTMENGRSSCRPCNKVKGHKTIDEWKKYAAGHGLKNGD